MANQPKLYISREDLVPYIKQQGEELSRQLSEARAKYKEKYNTKNKFEVMISRLGDPRLVPEGYADELFRISSKKSGLPASVRYPVREICEAAMNRCYLDKLLSLRVDFDKARDGDVMLGGKCLFIYKGIDVGKRFCGTERAIVAHAIWNYASEEFMEGPRTGVGTFDGGIAYYKATREQEEELMARIREHGYEWDAEKKELRKT